MAAVLWLQRAAGNAAATHACRSVLAGDGNRIQGSQQGAPDDFVASRADGLKRYRADGAGTLSSRGTLADSVRGRSETGARGGVTTPAVQRAPAAGSDEELAGLYRKMMESSTFRSLDAAVNPRSSMKLTYGDATLYDQNRHEIKVKRSARENVNLHQILFEMHNAQNRGFRRNAPDMEAEALGALAAANKDLAIRYRKAARALAIEWSEWAFLPELVSRARRINAENASIRVSNVHEDDAKIWKESFVKYLVAALTRHTRRYDPAANGTDWVGLKILDVAIKNFPTSLVVTDEEIKEFESGMRARVKPIDDNPFVFPGVVRAAFDKHPPEVPPPTPQAPGLPLSQTPPPSTMPSEDRPPTSTLPPVTPSTPRALKLRSKRRFLVAPKSESSPSRPPEDSLEESTLKMNAGELASEADPKTLESALAAQEPSEQRRKDDLAALAVKAGELSRLRRLDPSQKLDEADVSEEDLRNKLSPLALSAGESARSLRRR